jgi:tetratricopeptide (TPR) repeat protein
MPAAVKPLGTPLMRGTAREFNRALTFPEKNGMFLLDCVIRSVLVHLHPPIVRHVVISCLIVILILLSFAFSSCSMVDSAGAYFNTYYNAQRTYDQAEKDALTQMEARPGGKNFMQPCQLQAGTRGKFATVIEKCSKILQYHPNSSLVDDALMMIGKSYFYSDEDQSADRKFREIISAYPDGGLDIEARLYLSYALYRMRQKDDAQQSALAVVEAAERKGENGLQAQACTLLGRINEEDKDYARARDFYQQAAVKGESSEQQVTAYLQVAEMYTRLGQFEAAEGAYRKAESAANNYVGEYRGMMGAARMLGKQKKYDEAVQTLSDLRSKSTYREFFGEIELETANLLRDGGNLDGAIERYRMIDTTYARTEVSAKSYLALGELYENTLRNYDSAFVAYTKGKGESNIPELAQKLSRKSESLTRYRRYRNDIDKMDSLKVVLLAHALQDTVSADSVRRDTLGGTTASLADSSGTPSAPRPAVAATDTSRKAPAILPRITLDSLQVRLANTMNELAGLFYVTIGRSDSAAYWYGRVLDDYPNGIHAPRALYTLAEISRSDSASADTTKADSLYRVIIDRFPESEFAAEARHVLRLPPRITRKDEAAASFERAEHLMLAGQDSLAIDTLAHIVMSYPASPYSPRALYASSWLYEQKLSRPDSALAGYQRLLALYPTSSWAAGIRSRIAGVLALAKADEQARADSTAKKKAVEGVRAEELDGQKAIRKRRSEESPVEPPKPGAAAQPKKEDNLLPE